MKLSEFQERILSLGPEELEQFVAQLLHYSGRFAEVKLSGPGPDRGIDIEAIEKADLASGPRRWYFQVKKVKLAGVDIASYAGSLLSVLKAVNPKAEVVLVLAGAITPQASHRLQELGIEVWDATKLFWSATPKLLEDYFGESAVESGATEIVSSKAKALSEALSGLEPGKPKWPAYQRLAADILEFLFCPPLEPPRYEFSDAEVRNRRDIILENNAAESFWANLRTTYSAHYIVADAKNYSGYVKKEPVLAIAHYLKPYGCGMFALLLTRKGAADAAAHAVREQWIGANKMIVIFSDVHLMQMLELRAAGGRPEEVIRRAIADLRTSL